MAALISANNEIFTEKSYREFLEKQNSLSLVHNERLRDKDETIFDALSSPLADITNDPEYQEVISTIKNYTGSGK